jgi:hypothetical protein
MSEELAVIEKVQSQIADLERQLEKKRAFVNELCSLAGTQAIYAIADAGPSHVLATRPDDYYGKPMATAVTLILEKRKSARLNAASVNEIYDELVRGGFQFEAKNPENAKRGLYGGMSKNPKFHKLPNGTYGLREWYDNVRETKKATNGKDQEKTAGDKPLHEELQEDSVAEAEAVTAGNDKAPAKAK